MASLATTTDYDLRYDRAQTLEGAKARYVENGNGYGIDALEADVERVLDGGENPDRERPPLSALPNNRAYGP